MTFKIVGGLGLFLLGMRYMSDGLQTVAGPSLRKVISSVTNNRLMAVVAGIFVTCLVQSSSVSTVMAIGFINSGIMALTQAMGIVLGANIGTTITGWILVLKIGKYGLPIIGISSFFYLFSKKEKTKYLALAIIGIGMIFFGLELMKSGFKPMRSQESFLQWFNMFDASTSLGMIKCILVGCILTFIVQSSSATLGITIGLAYQGLLDFQSAGALVLGENIGTTITAMLASIGASANARRAAYFHVFFNLVGVCIICCIFSTLYMPFIKWVLAEFSNVPNVMAATIVDGKEVYPHTTLGIATVHSVFNVLNVVIFLPFIGYIASFLNNFVKDDLPSDKKHLTHLDFKNFDSGFAAIEQSKFEVNKMSEHTFDMMDNLGKVLNKDEQSSNIHKELFEREDILDLVQKEITIFLTDVRSGPISHDLVKETNLHLFLADEYESISDYIVQIIKLEMRLEKHEQSLKPYQKEELLSLHKKITELFGIILDSNTNRQELHIKACQASDHIKDSIRMDRSNHWDHISNQQLSPLLTTTYTDILVAYRKINDHLLHISEALTES